MTVSVDTPESMKDWPFFNQTGSNSMALLFILGIIVAFSGFFLWSAYRTHFHKSNRERVVARRMMIIGTICVIIALIGWNFLGWSVHDYH